MKDLVCSVSAGIVGGTPLVDVDYDEEAYEHGSVDIPIAVMPRTGELTLLQMDGEAPKEDVLKAISMAKEACIKIYEVQKNALKEKYNNGGNKK